MSKLIFIYGIAVITAILLPIQVAVPDDLWSMVIMGFTACLLIAQILLYLSFRKDLDL